MHGRDRVARTRATARALTWLVAAALAAVWCVFVAANGPTWSSFALLAVVLFGPVLTFAARASGPARARFVATLVALVLVDVAYITSKLEEAPRAAQALRLCEGRRCDVAPLASRLVAERETVRAGLLTASVAGFIGGDEAHTLARLLERAYARHERDPRFRSAPNVVLVRSGRLAPRYLLWAPRTTGPAPCLVFLHGFGGALSVYVEALVAAGLDDMTIVAPVGDKDGYFDSDAARASLVTLLERHLPPDVDRTRVFLVGLSNGAVSLSRLLDDPDVRRHVRGAVFVSGAGEPGARALDALPLLFVAGEDDPRFAIEGIVHAALAYQRRRAHVELEVVPGDHFILLAEAERIARRLRAFVLARR